METEEAPAEMTEEIQQKVVHMPKLLHYLSFQSGAYIPKVVVYTCCMHVIGDMCTACHVHVMLCSMDVYMRMIFYSFLDFL